MHKTIVALSLACLASLLPVLAQAQSADGATTPGARARDPEKMRQKFDERFKKADSNGDDKLSKAEAQSGMPRVASNFEAIDADKDGFVTKAEIQAAMAKRGAAKGGGAAVTP